MGVRAGVGIETPQGRRVTLAGLAGLAKSANRPSSGHGWQTNGMLLRKTLIIITIAVMVERNFPAAIAFTVLGYQLKSKLNDGTFFWLVKIGISMGLVVPLFFFSISPSPGVARESLISRVHCAPSHWIALEFQPFTFWIPTSAE